MPTNLLSILHSPVLLGPPSDKYIDGANVDKWADRKIVRYVANRTYFH